MVATPEIIAEAIRKYPVGTVFVPAHVRKGEYTVQEGDYPHDDQEYIHLYDKKHRCRRGSLVNPVIWYDGLWARIIFSPVPVLETIQIW